MISGILGLLAIFGIAVLGCFIAIPVIILLMYYWEFIDDKISDYCIKREEKRDKEIELEKPVFYKPDFFELNSTIYSTPDTLTKDLLNLAKSMAEKYGEDYKYWTVKVDVNMEVKSTKDGLSINRLKYEIHGKEKRFNVFYIDELGRQCLTLLTDEQGE